MLHLRVKHGSLSFEADGALTFDDVQEMIEAAGLSGVPKTALLTAFYYRINGPICTIDINWVSPDNSVVVTQPIPLIKT